MSWINIKTRLPKVGKNTGISAWCVVQCGINRKPEYKAVQYYGWDEKLWYTHWLEEISHITHWQYLEPPKDK